MRKPAFNRRLPIGVAVASSTSANVLSKPPDKLLVSSDCGGSCIHITSSVRSFPSEGLDMGSAARWVSRTYYINAPAACSLVLLFYAKTARILRTDADTTDGKLY